MDRSRTSTSTFVDRHPRPAAPTRERDPVDGTTAEFASLIDRSPRVRTHAALQAMASASPRVTAAVQRREAIAQSPRATGPTLRTEALTRGGERGLPGSIAGDMARAFDTDFSGLRVHRSSPAAAQLGAEALTVDGHVHFAPGHFAPHTHTGRSLVGHELAHVVQQQGGGVNPQVLYKGVGLNTDATLERQADEAGERAARGEPAGLSSPSPGAQTGGGAVQAKLGFELEMLVLVDIGGRPLPEKTQIGSYGPCLTLDVDQGPAVDSPTPTLPQNAHHDLPQAATLTPFWYHQASDTVYPTLVAATAAHAGLVGVSQHFQDTVLGREYDLGEVDWTFGYKHTATGAVYADQAAALAAHPGLVGVERVYVDAGGNEQHEHPQGPGMGSNRYASILEIVTQAYSPETPMGRAQIIRAMRDAVELADALETRGYTNTRAPLHQLSNKIQTVSNNIHVGHPNQPAQTTDASIQTTVGVDLAHIGSFIDNIVGFGSQAPFVLKHDSDYFVHSDLHGNVFHARAQEELGRARLDANRIINHIGHAYGVGLNSPLVNMRGLLMLICQYLRMGRYAYSGGSWCLDKNITPFLSRTNLSHIRQNQLGAAEQAWLNHHIAAIPARIYAETERNHLTTLFTDATEVQNNPAHGINLTVQTFVNNVLTQNLDGITDQLGGMKLIGAENIDPLQARGPGPRLGPVFEIRNEIPKDEAVGERFPRGSWLDLANFWVKLIGMLNARTEAQATQDARLTANNQIMQHKPW
jgi:hypothetical protein